MSHQELEKEALQEASFSLTKEDAQAYADGAQAVEGKPMAKTLSNLKETLNNF